MPRVCLGCLGWRELRLQRSLHQLRNRNLAILLKEPLKADKPRLNLVLRLRYLRSDRPFSLLAVEMARYALSQVGCVHLLVPLEPDTYLVPKFQEC